MTPEPAQDQVHRHAVQLTHTEGDLILDALRDYAEGCRNSDGGEGFADQADLLADAVLAVFDTDHREPRP